MERLLKALEDFILRRTCRTRDHLVDRSVHQYDYFRSTHQDHWVLWYAMYSLGVGILLYIFTPYFASKESIAFIIYVAQFISIVLIRWLLITHIL